jgi:hypothetical protein
MLRGTPVPSAMTAVALCLLAHAASANACDKQAEPAVLKKHAKAVHAVAFSGRQDARRLR